MAKCKSCSIDFSKLKKTSEFKFPENIPISNEMRTAVENIRKQQNKKGSKKRR